MCFNIKTKEKILGWNQRPNHAAKELNSIIMIIENKDNLNVFLF